MEPGASDKTVHPSDDETFLDDAYASILELLEDGLRPEPMALAASRPHLLGEIMRLVEMARLVAPFHERALPVLPGYEVFSRLGAGGMGEVLLCRQLKMGGRLVAVKVLSDAFSSARRLELLHDEALALARLRHPGVVDVYEFIVGRDPETNAMVHAFAMQWIEGCSLAEWAAEVQRRVSTAGDAPTTRAAPRVRALGVQDPMRFACACIASVARTLQAVHEAGLLHRDIKPSNILLREDGSALLSDFGLAQALGDEQRDDSVSGFSGTREFASPEQIRGDPLDARSDVYSLGATLRRVLARSVPRDLAAIVHKATSARPEARYASAGDFAADIERFLSHRAVVARPPGMVRRVAMCVRRNRRATLATLLGSTTALFIAGAVILVAFIAPRRAEEHLRLARLELLNPEHANAIWNVEWFGERDARFEHDPSVIGRAVASYQAAIRWRPWGEWSNAVRRELRVLLSGDVEPDDLRCKGLAAYLHGDASAAIDAWNTLAAREEPDAFINAALGVLYLVREKHSLAYPRLEQARTAFPHVGFLAAYHADAAVGCGDLDRAERLLEEAARFENQDHRGALLRVRGDLLLARGRFDEALDAILHATLQARTIRDLQQEVGPGVTHQDAMVRHAVNNPIAAVRIARILHASGDDDGAINALGAAFALGMGPDHTRNEFRAYVQQWWGKLNAAARRGEIRRALDLGPSVTESLAFRLRTAFPESRSAVGTGARGVGQSPTHRLCVALHTDFVALGAAASHTSLDRAPLDEIARRLEVPGMASWKQIEPLPEGLKELQLLAWDSFVPCTGSEILDWLRRAAGGRASTHVRDDSPPP